MRQLVITAVGPDRPGLIGKLTAPLYEASANVADSRMVNLRGQFALILLAEIPPAQVEQVQQSLQALAEQLGSATLVIAVRANDPARRRYHRTLKRLRKTTIPFVTDRPVWELRSRRAG